MSTSDYSVYATSAYPQTFGELLYWSLARIPDPETKVYFRLTGQEPITYAQFARNVGRICNLFVSLGLRKGDHVAIFLSNSMEYAYLYHALSKCGLVMVPLNQFLRGESLRYIIDHADAVALITSRALFEEKIAPVQDALPKIERVLFVDELAPDCRAQSSLFADYLQHDTRFVQPEPVSGSDLQGIWYTSGTTGLPKGVSTTQCAYVFRALFYADYFRMKSTEVVYYVLPQYHVAYMVFGGPFAMAAGCEIVQVDWFSASRFWSDINRYNVSVTFSTGTIVPVMLGQPIGDAERQGQAHLRLWVGWPVDDPAALRARWPNTKFMELYGTTEAGNATICDFDHPQLGTAGPPAPYTELQIVDPQTGAERPHGQEGEIKVRNKLGPDYILRGYYKDPEKTRQTLVDGWWHSGDMGLIDAQGCLRFMARIKDYLRVGGENVSTRVVEKYLCQHPAVAEAAVVGTQNELGHDELVAHLVLKPDAVIDDPTAFFIFCNREMPYFMVPRFLVLQRELPKTATQRIEKYKLQQSLPHGAIDRKQLGIELKR
jgi:crotonobetaine/carnitine-CoA ligase